MEYLLSLKGGGIRGTLTTCFLIELEKQLGCLTREAFSFIAGTSTGALIASAVAAGLPATEILRIYTERSKEIFNAGTLEATALQLSRGWAYEPDKIRIVLESEFGHAKTWTLNDCPIKLLLTAKSVDGKRPWYFVQDNPKNAKTTGNLSLISCAVASAAAPWYFAPWYVNPTSGELIGWCYDGGTGVTANPVYQACVEAFYFDSFDPTKTRVISLGTGFFPGMSPNPPDGPLATIEWVIDSLLSSADDQQTEIVSRHFPGILRSFDWPLPSPIGMADVSAIPDLVKLGQALASQMDWKTILNL